VDAQPTWPPELASLGRDQNHRHAAPFQRGSGSPADRLQAGELAFAVRTKDDHFRADLLRDVEQSRRGVSDLQPRVHDQTAIQPAEGAASLEQEPFPGLYLSRPPGGDSVQQAD
jgi:hypothetical protein